MPGQNAKGNVDLALLAVRIALAVVFLYHGSQILFGTFGGPGIAGFAQFMKMPAVVAALVGIAQFGGGLAMLTGLLARLGAAGIAIVMLGAIFLVHISHGFEVAKNGIEFALTELLLALAILAAGPGGYVLPLPGAARPAKAADPPQ